MDHTYRFMLAVFDIKSNSEAQILTGLSLIVDGVVEDDKLKHRRL